MSEATIAGSTLATAAAWWRWNNLDKETLAEALALRLMAYSAGIRARKNAVAEAMAKEIKLI